MTAWLMIDPVIGGELRSGKFARSVRSENFMTGNHRFVSRWAVTISAVFALVGLSQAATAGVLTLGGTTIGNLVIEGPFVQSDAFTGGVNFWAHWSLAPGQTTVDEANLRWLQLASFSKHVPGFPDRPFIDPRSDQNLGSVLADSEPWYDITGGAKNTLSLTGGGDDPWMGDGPFAQWAFAPLTFTADTLVVLITDLAAKQARVLGGVHWGYTINSIAGVNEVLPTGVTDLSNTAAVRGAFNAQLALDFPGWTLIVPEPSGLVLAMLAALGLWAAPGRFR
jgi:hypothetical protein